MQTWVLSFCARIETREAEYYKSLCPNFRSCLPNTLIAAYEKNIREGTKGEFTHFINI